MDTSIKVKNAKTGQECTFDTREQLQAFGENIADREDWAVVEAQAEAADTTDAGATGDAGTADQTAA